MTKKTYSFDHFPPREGTNCVKWDLRKAYFGKSDILPLWVADMDFETPDFIVDKIRERLDHPILGYTVRPDSFNQAFINWCEKKYQWKVKKEWMNFSPGVVSAVTMAVQGFTKPGDEVITQPPVYFPFFYSIKNTGRSLIYNPLKEINGRLCMDFEQLESIITAKTKMIIISNPHNPGGSVWTKKEFIQLGEICEKHQIMVVSDEIHSDLVFHPHQHLPFAKVVPQEKVKSISCMAASKTFNLAGLSTSLVIAPDAEVMKVYNQHLQVSHLNMGNIFGSIATQAAYTEGSDWLAQLMSYLLNNRNYLHEFINTRLKPLRMLIPEATYMAWIDFSGLELSQDRLNYWLINEAKVAMNSGTLFGQGGEGYIRINFACPRSLLQEALERIEKAIKKL
ncbi:MAG: PatB family C-S lyase [Bacteroidales bacterium]|nr:PatB family C-S lyase [Bacteroidales bacterium]